MSDYVQFRMEGTLKELSTYQKHSIFTESEIATIISRRKSYEYKIHRTDKILLDFLHYINYEQKLEKIVIKRTQSKKFRFITMRILYLCTTALKKFDDPQLLKMFIEYGTKRKEFEFMKEFLTSSTMKNTSDVDLFIYAASICMRFGDFESGRMFILSGIRFNSGEKRLYVELFRLEVEHVKRCRAINEVAGVESNDRIDSGALALAVVDEFVERFGVCEESRVLVDISGEFGDIREKVLSIIK